MPISGHDTDEVMNMKKFLGGIKKNIFYISLITGMAVLVTVLGLITHRPIQRRRP